MSDASPQPDGSHAALREVCTRLGFGDWFEGCPSEVQCAEQEASDALSDSSPRLLDDAATRILLTRQFVKVLAAVVRREAISEALRAASSKERIHFFANAARMLEPKLGHSALGDPPGAFFDPACWDLTSIPAESTREKDLRLASIAAAMLVQEEGVHKQHVTLEELSAAIVRARNAS